jgi:cytochrome c2
MLSALSRPKLIALALAAICIASAVGVGLSWWSRFQSEKIARTITNGDPARATEIMRRYGCAGCHTIPGVPGGDGRVGGSLAELRQRVYIAGVTTNSPDNLVRWIVSPQAFSPKTAMPASGISEAEARDVAAYLYAQ